MKILLISLWQFIKIYMKAAYQMILFPSSVMKRSVEVHRRSLKRIPAKRFHFRQSEWESEDQSNDENWSAKTKKIKTLKRNKEKKRNYVSQEMSEKHVLPLFLDENGLQISYIENRSSDDQCFPHELLYLEFESSCSKGKLKITFPNNRLIES